MALDDHSDESNSEFYVTVRAGDAVPVDQLRQVAASSAMTGPIHGPGNWMPSVKAFPASAQLPRD